MSKKELERAYLKAKEEIERLREELLWSSLRDSLAMTKLFYG